MSDEEVRRRMPMLPEHIIPEIERLRATFVWKKPQREFTTHEWLNLMEKLVEQGRVAAGNQSDPRSRLLRMAAFIFECLESDGPL